MSIEKINASFSNEYNGATLTIVAEDGYYTTAYIERNSNINAYDLMDENNPNGYTFSPKTRHRVLNELKKIVDMEVSMAR